jgi:two-component system nitrogen regulation sensor histidine kinase GlnL
MKATNSRDAITEPLISWEQILVSLEDAVITLDQEGKVSFFNEAAEVLTEVPLARALKEPYPCLFRKEPWLVKLLGKSWPPGQESSRGEGELVTRGGQQVPVNVTVSPLRNPRGDFIGSILLMRNLTYRRELEEDLKRADRLALMGTLAAGLAHEIRNPLGGIKGAAQLLRRSLNGDPSLLEYTRIMVREVDRVNELIEQLLALSRPIKLHLVPLNIHAILDDVLMLETHSVRGTKIVVKKQFDPSLPLIRGDRGQLIQVFLNLVQNAFQAMQEPGTVTITTRAETDFHIRGQGTARKKFIWVDIQDEGIGIKKEDLSKIFSPFFTTKNAGTGLGLAVCYRIVKEHGGLIRVQSAEGKGTTFKVSLVVAS